MGRYSKAIASLLGSLTPAAVITILGLVGVHVSVALAGGICTVGALIATYLAPANDPSSSPPAAQRVG